MECFIGRGKNFQLNSNKFWIRSSVKKKKLKKIWSWEEDGCYKWLMILNTPQNIQRRLNYGLTVSRAKQHLNLWVDLKRAVTAQESHRTGSLLGKEKKLDWLQREFTSCDTCQLCYLLLAIQGCPYLQVLFCCLKM